MGVRVTVLNADAVLNGLKKRFESGLQPALEKAKEVVEAKFDQNPAGWVPLKASTLYQRSRLGFGTGPMLYREGTLKANAVQEIALDSPTSGHISTTYPLAVLQNNGKGPLPGRSFYSLLDADKKQIFEAFKAGIKG